MHDTKVAVDGTVAIGAITMPWWAVFLNEWAGLIATLAGLALVIIRLLLAIREWREKDIKNANEPNSY